MAKIAEEAKEAILLSSPSLVDTLYAWRVWIGSDDQVREWANDIIAKDDGMILFVEQFGFTGTSQGFGDRAGREKYRLDPKQLEP